MNFKKSVGKRRFPTPELCTFSCCIWWQLVKDSHISSLSSLCFLQDLEAKRVASLDQAVEDEEEEEQPVSKWKEVFGPESPKVVMLFNYFHDLHGIKAPVFLLSPPRFCNSGLLIAHLYQHIDLHGGLYQEQPLYRYWIMFVKGNNFEGLWGESAWLLADRGPTCPNFSKHCIIQKMACKLRWSFPTFCQGILSDLIGIIYFVFRNLWRRRKTFQNTSLASSWQPTFRVKPLRRTSAVHSSSHFWPDCQTWRPG